MASGVVATVSLVVAPSTEDTSSQVELSVPMAADPSGFPLTAAASGATVTIIQPPALSAFSCLPVTITYPAPSTCTLQLSADAPSGGASIALSTSLPDVTVPPTVPIPQGSSSATFNAVPLAVTGPTAVNLTASYLGSSEGFGININPGTAALSNVSVNPAVQTGGLTVTLSSSNGSVASVPTSVTVAQGSTAAAFTVTTFTVSAVSFATITASYSGGKVTESLTVNPRPHPLSSIQVSPGTIQSGQTASGTVTLSAAAGAGGAVVYLFSSNMAAVTVPASVTVAQGATSAAFTATAGTVSTNNTVALTAFHAGITATTYLTVTHTK